MSTFFNRRKQQRGDVLLEALIGVLITAVLGVGMVQVVAQIALGQRNAKVENYLVEQLREQLQMGGLSLCDHETTALHLPGAENSEAQALVNCSGSVLVDMRIGRAAGTHVQLSAPTEILLSVSASEMGNGDSGDHVALVVGTFQFPASGLTAASASARASAR